MRACRGGSAVSLLPQLVWESPTGAATVAHLQLFRDKMDSVNAWLHASALPKGLKQRIRAYYAGGCSGPLVWSALAV